MNSTRVLLLCSSRLALPALQQLAYLGVLVGVVVPRHCDEWIENVQFVLHSSTIPIKVVDKGTYVKELLNVIEEWHITLGLMVTFSFHLPSTVFELPVQGFFNVHPGPLPQYRGADPIFQQIVKREKQAVVTVHHVSDRYDSGAIVLQERIRMHVTDTYGMLTTRLGSVAAQLVMLLLKMIDMGLGLPSKPQDEAQAFYHQRHRVTEVTINWKEMDALVIVALINACNPWNKGALTQLNGRIVRLLEAVALPECPIPTGCTSGTILALESNRMLVCSKGCVLSVNVLHLEEGYVSASRLKDIGFTAGQVFDSNL